MKLPFFTWLFLIPIVSGQCLDDQKSLLLQLHNSLQFGKTSSTKLVHWNQCVDCCLWKGVYCSQGRVIGLDLSSESIFAIPIAILCLTSLVILDLSTFYFPVLKLENPTLHMLVRNLGELMELHLDGVNMSAQGNEWCQIISSSLPNLRVSTLEILDLSNNPLLHGSLPNFPRNRSLKTLVLSKTKFSGTFSDSIVNLTVLSRIDLPSCNFHASIPYLMANLTQLLYLDMSMNYFTRSIPSFSMAKNLTEINLSHNHLTNQITSTRWEVLLSLVNLDLCNNSLDESIPLSLFSLSSLQKLQLSKNQFLEVLYLGKNNITDTIPYIFPSNCGLQTLSLNGNQLEGGLPKSLANCTSFTGTTEIVIDVSYNNLEGTIPEEIRGINSLGAKSHHLGKLSRLISLDLSSNKLTGKMPKNLKNLTLLSTLNLLFNHLVGHIPGMRFPKPSYKGNEGLCGVPLHEECNDAGSRLPTHSNVVIGRVDWNIITAKFGFICGLGIIILP
ncbi:hypothetical protein I3843_09G208900, partial [Carya illinoinensis]